MTLGSGASITPPRCTCGRTDGHHGLTCPAAFCRDAYEEQAFWLTTTRQQSIETVASLLRERSSA